MEIENKLLKDELTALREELATAVSTHRTHAELQTSWPTLKAAYDEAQATITQQVAEIERLKGGPVLFVAVESIEDP